MANRPSFLSIPGRACARRTPWGCHGLWVGLGMVLIVFVRNRLCSLWSYLSFWGVHGAPRAAGLIEKILCGWLVALKGPLQIKSNNRSELERDVHLAIRHPEMRSLEDLGKARAA